MSPKGKQRNDDDGAPKPVSLYTLTLTAEQLNVLHQALEQRSWIPKAVEHSAFAYEGPRVNVVGYKSGKLVVQGKGTEEFVSNILEPEVTKVARLGYEEINNPEWFALHAGCDEAGKGDIFGPLVTACVIGGAAQVRYWREQGVKDSKALSDAQVLKLEKVIKNTVGATVRTAQCSMVRYNELMAKPTANLNRLLAWLHARSLADALDEQKAEWGILDQFATRDAVDSYLKRPEFKLIRRTKAESDPVVAAASIVARAGYLHGMRELSEKAGVTLMKGASAEAQKQFAKLREEKGKEAMADYGKLHFKLRAIGEGGPKVEWKKR